MRPAALGSPGASAFASPQGADGADGTAFSVIPKHGAASPVVPKRKAAPSEGDEATLVGVQARSPPRTLTRVAHRASHIFIKRHAWHRILRNHIVSRCSIFRARMLTTTACSHFWWCEGLTGLLAIRSSRRCDLLSHRECYRLDIAIALLPAR